MHQEDYESLYRELERPLFNIVYRWVWREDVAMDLVQEAFVKLWERRGHIRVGTARAYVTRTALNLAANRLRRAKLVRMFGLEDLEPRDGGGDSEQHLLDREQNLTLRKAIETLPEKQRGVLLLCRFGEMSQAQVAEVLGIPEGTVASRHHKALKRLEAALTRSIKGDTHGRA